MTQFELQRRNPALHKKIGNQAHCVTPEDLEEIIKLDRLQRILIKCGNGRFTCPAQDVNHFIKIIDQHRKLAEAIIGTQKPGACGQLFETDYVRSIEFMGD